MIEAMAHNWLTPVVRFSERPEGDPLRPPVQYVDQFVPDADAALYALRGLDWERRDDAPRCEYYCNDFGLPYVYGRGRGRRTYFPRGETPAIRFIRDLVEKRAGCTFEVCFLNRYLDQSDHLGWHADDSPEMDDSRPIAVVSFGVPRAIFFRPRGSDSDPSARTELVLGHGSVCLMAPGMQDAWDHRIPKASFLCGDRISLTFRGYVHGVEGEKVLAVADDKG